MEFEQKRVLLNMVYYTTIAVMIALVVFLFISLNSASLANWERVSLYVVIGLLVALVIYDIICTCLNRDKYIAGFILYVITLALVILSLIMFAINSANGRLLIDISERFFRLILFSYIIDILVIVIYCVGQSLVKRDSISRKNK